MVALGVLMLGLVLAGACAGGDSPPQGPYVYVSDVEMGYDHLQPGVRTLLQARVCAVYGTGEAAAGVEVAGTAHGPGVLTERSSAFAEPDGCALVTWPVADFGQYTIKVERLWLNRVEYFPQANVEGSASIEVGEFSMPIIVQP